MEPVSVIALPTMCDTEPVANGAPPGWAASRAACTVGQAIHRSVSKRNLLPSPRAFVCDVRTHKPSPNETCSEDGPPAPPYRLSTRRTNTACVCLLCSLADHKYSSCMESFQKYKHHVGRV